jgi:hypothetical protein
MATEGSRAIEVTIVPHIESAEVAWFRRRPGDVERGRILDADAMVEERMVDVRCLWTSLAH